jgi:hypothetical protein
MRQSFNELWEAMEARRQQTEVGEGQPALGLEGTRPGQRRGCLDEEALSGWVDGELRRHSLRRWLLVWRHVRIERCRACLAEVEGLADAKSSARPRLSWLVSVVTCMMRPLQMRKASLAWASSMLMIVVGLSLWSFGSHGTFQVGVKRPTAPPIEETKIPPAGEEPSPEAQPEHIIWGD